MNTKITIVPDLYYRNWDEDDPNGPGELWLCLRPFVNGAIDEGDLPALDDFRAWARDSADGSLFEYEWIRSDSSCRPEDTDLLPVNLPDNIDLRVTINGQNSNYVIERSSHCRIVRPDGPSIGQNLFAEHSGANSGTPFPSAFNASLRDELAKVAAETPNDLAGAIFGATQLLDFGRRYRWTERQVHPLWNNNSLPIPELDSGLPEGEHITGLYWLLGLMIPLGTQRDIAKIHAITGFELSLCHSGTGAVVCEEVIPRLQLGEVDSVDTYFSRIGQDFRRSLSIAIADREDVTYVQPDYHAMALDKAYTGAGALWRLQQPAGVANDAGDLERVAASEAREQVSQGLPLSSLAGLEVRPQEDTAGLLAAGLGLATPLAAPLPIAIEPGLSGEGTLSHYRRFPQRPRTNEDTQRHPVVLQFEPEADFGAALQRFYQDLPEAQRSDLFSRYFNAVLAEASVSGWQLELLHYGVLPWDGEFAKFKLLAVPLTDAPLPDVGESLGFQTQSVTLFLHAPRFSAIDRPISLAPNILNGERALWHAEGANSPASLRSHWDGQCALSGFRYNALRVRGLAAGAQTDSLTFVAMPLDDLNFAAAESVVRLEKVLELEGSNLCEDPFDPDDPKSDYEDDLENYNTAVLFRDGEVVDPFRYRIPQPIESDGGGHLDFVGRKQWLPLIESFPREPSDLVMQLRRDGEPVPAEFDRNDIRDEIANQYNIDGTPQTFEVQLEHTYGDRDISTGTLLLSQRFDWTPELAANVEWRKSQTDNQPFLRAEYPGGDNLILHVDLSLLEASYVPPDQDDEEPLDGTMQGDEAYVAAVAAWRSLAEFLRPGAQVEVIAQAATYDFLATLPADDPAGYLAKARFSGGFAEAVATRLTISTTATEALRELAEEAFASSGPLNPSRRSITLTLPSGPHGDLGKEAHLARVDLRVVRAQDDARPQQEVLLPISQQPGLFTTIEKSLQGIWANLGFGPGDGPMASGDATFDTALLSQHAEWSLGIREGQGTVLTAQEAGTRIDSALVAALDGTHWFAPVGPGPLAESRLRAHTLLVPFGFAPTRPVGGLMGSTHLGLQRFATALKDVIDLAYLSWTTHDAARWRARFASITRLATPTGRLTQYIDRLTADLLFAEAAVDEANDSRITDLGTAAEQGRGDLAYFRKRVGDGLLQDPALFHSSKAMLLTAIRFEPVAGDASPRIGSLARGKFERAIRPSGGNGQLPANVVSLLTLEHLLLTGIASTGDFAGRLGFLEFLDDNLYDNAFEIPVGTGSTLESFEQVVDEASTDPATWDKGEIVTPDRAKPDTVYLASRAVINPPVAFWAGPAEEMARKLRDPDHEWNLGQLLERDMNAAGDALQQPFEKHLGSAATFADTDIVYVLYRIEGDEETEGTVAALENDGFFIRVSSNHSTIADARREVFTTAEQQFERHLGSLIDAPVGSPGAADAVAAILALGGSDDVPNQIDDAGYVKAVERFVQPSAAELPPTNYSLSLPRAGASLSLAPRPHSDGSGDPGLLRDIALFAKRDFVPNEVQVGYLLCGMRTDVWRTRQMELIHGRNLDYRGWQGADDARKNGIFAREFWQSAPQATQPVAFTVTRICQNEASDWGRPLMRRDLDERLVTISALYGSLLRSEEIAIRREAGDVPGAATTYSPIISDVDPQLMLERALYVSIYHEQFETDVDEPGATPTSRLLLATHAVSSVAEFEARIPALLPEQYNQFSVDFSWYSATGTPVLQLRRLFLQVT